jgi:riboflavin kinase/FMN adenylyltransferase
MEIIYDLNDICCEPTVATIGSFDGVHRGHVAMIEETRRMAAAMNLPVTLITFARHPRMIFDAEPQPFLLSSQADAWSGWRLRAWSVAWYLILIASLQR